MRAFLKDMEKTPIAQNDERTTATSVEQAIQKQQQKKILILCRFEILGEQCVYGPACPMLHFKKKEEMVSFFSTNKKHLTEFRKRVKNVELITEKIVFLDGDNVIQSVKAVVNVIANRNPRIQYVIFYSKETAILHPQLFSSTLTATHPNISFIYALTNTKNAADVALSMELFMLDYFLNEDIPFQLISKDTFAVEAVARIRMMGRECTVFESVHDDNAPQKTVDPIYEEQMNQLIAKIDRLMVEETMIHVSVIGYKLELPGQLKILYGNWAKFLANQLVQERLGAVLIEDSNGGLILMKTKEKEGKG